MAASPSRTLGIQRATPPKRRGKRFGLALVVLLAGAATAVALVFAGQRFADQKAREKIQSYADRAGLDIEVGQVVLLPGAPVTLLKVTVRDPADGRLLATAAEVQTDLTLKTLLDGQRRPGRITIIQPTTDLTEPQRWRDAAERFVGNSATTTTGPGRRFPTVLLSNATLSIPKVAGRPAEVSGVDAVVERDADRRWTAALTGHWGELTVRVDAVKAANDTPEAGVTFDPPLELALPETGAVTLRSAWIHVDRAVRISDVTFKAMGTSGRAQLITVIAGVEAGVWGQGGAQIELRKVLATRDGETLQADRATASLASGPRRDVLERLRGVVLAGLDARSKTLHAAVRAAHVNASLSGFDPERPLAGLSKLAVVEADIAVALPTRPGLPLFQDLRALVGGASGPAGGGGPGMREPPPQAGLNRWLDGATPSLSLTDSSVALTLGAGTKPTLVVEQLDATLRPGQESGNWDGSARGKLHEPATGEEGDFEIAAITDAGGGLQRARIKLSGSKLANRLADLSDSIRLSDSASLSIDLIVAPHATGRGLTASGTVGMRDVGFLAPRIHGSPVDGIRVEADLNLDLKPDEQKLILDVPRLSIMDRGVVRLAATVERLDGRLPKLSMHLRVPEQPCNDLLHSIPPSMVPRLKGLELEGTAHGFFTFEVDLEKPRTYDHDIDVDMRKCKAIRYGEANVPRLNRRFVSQVKEKGQEIGVEVGPGTPHYRPLKRIPRHIRMGAIWTEDQRFYQHSGFVKGLIERAVVMNLEGGRYRYGGSSITQQLVKNLFLSREKTLTRKLEEAILVWLVERNVTKNRILELYLNCIEYGPSIYGIGPAARAYFGKHVEQLRPLEGAFLMGLKPYPWAGWQQFERGYVKPWWHKRLSKILTGMTKRGWITEEDLEASRPFDPVFLTSAHAPLKAPERDDWAPPPTPNAPNVGP